MTGEPGSPEWRPSWATLGQSIGPPLVPPLVQIRDQLAQTRITVDPAPIERACAEMREGIGRAALALGVLGQALRETGRQTKR